MAGLGLLGVVAGLVLGSLLLRRLPTPGPAGSGGSGLLADASVIIPARDEEASLPALLASLAAQTITPREVIVVDDGSVDATASLALAAGATLVRAGDPPLGWLGKPWACAQGVEAASGSRLVLLDADTVLAPDGLDRIVAAHEELAPDGLLSVQPYHRVERGYEQLSAVASLVPLIASGMGLSSARCAAVAFGPCLVTSRAALTDAGGFALVHDEITEDVALARAYGRLDRPVVCLAGGDALSFRMFPGGMRQLVDGWTRILVAGAGAAPVLLTLVAVGWVISVGAVGLAGGRELAAWVSGAGAPSSTVAALWVAVSAQMAWMLRRVGSFRWWCWAVFPVPLLAFMLLFARSTAFRVMRWPLSWRGRNIDMRSAAG